MTRRGWLVAVFASVLMMSPLVRGDDKPVEGDLKAMEGEWVQEIAGHEDTWTFKGKSVKLVAPSRTYEMTVKLDEKAKLKAADFTTNKGPEDAEGKTLLAIYKIDGDKLTICLSVMPDVRPTEFKQEEGSLFVFELKRKKK